MYASLRPSYDFLRHALAELDHRLKTLLTKKISEGGLGWLPYFSLVPRGSVITQTALGGGADLDVDIILPAEMAEWNIERIAEKNNKDRWKEFSEITGKLFRCITADGTGFKSNQLVITRSLKLQTVLNGTTLDIDLFPKLLDVHGHVWAPLSDKDANNNRVWDHVPHGPPAVQTDKWSDEQKLAVLLVKLWKAKWKESKRAQYAELEELEHKQDRHEVGGPALSDAEELRLAKLRALLKSFDFPKGYHLNLLMNHIVRLDPPRLEPQRFNVHKTVGYVRRLVRLAMMAYNSFYGRMRCCYLEQPDGSMVQPFLKDLGIAFPVYESFDDNGLLFQERPPDWPRPSRLQAAVIQRLHLLQQQTKAWVSTLLSSVPLRPEEICLGNDAAGFIPLRIFTGGIAPFSIDIRSGISDLFIMASRHMDSGTVIPLSMPMDPTEKLRVEQDPSHFLTVLRDIHIALQLLSVPAERLRPRDPPPAQLALFTRAKEQWGLHVVGENYEKFFPEASRRAYDHALFEVVKRRIYFLVGSSPSSEAWHLSQETVGILGESLVWVLPPMDELQVDRRVRPYIVLQKFNVHEQYRFKSILVSEVMELVSSKLKAVLTDRQRPKDSTADKSDADSSAGSSAGASAGSSARASVAPGAASSAGSATESPIAQPEAQQADNPTGLVNPLVCEYDGCSVSFEKHRPGVSGQVNAHLSESAQRALYKHMKDAHGLSEADALAYRQDRGAIAQGADALRRVREAYNFSTAISRRNLRLVDCGGAGHCFFLVLSFLLHGDLLHWGELRDMCADAITDPANCHEPWMQTVLRLKPSAADYAEGVRRNLWACCEVDGFVLAELLQIDLRIFPNNEAAPYLGAQDGLVACPAERRPDGGVTEYNIAQEHGHFRALVGPEKWRPDFSDDEIDEALRLGQARNKPQSSDNEPNGQDNTAP